MANCNLTLIIFRFFVKYENGVLENAKTMQFDDLLRSVSWNTQKAYMLAVGSFSGKILLVNADSYTIT